MSENPLQKFMHEIDGKSYLCMLGSDIVRNGMYLEVKKFNGMASDGFTSHSMMEIFRSDDTEEMTVSAFEDAIPFAVVEWLVAKARAELTPSTFRGTPIHE